MASYTKCPRCGETYESSKQHVCHVGGEEDVRKEKFAQETEGTGEN